MKNMEQKNYRPETDFEKSEFYELINTLQSIESEKLSEVFDKKFLVAREAIKIRKPFRVLLNNFINKNLSFIPSPGYRYVFAYGTLSICLFTIGYFAFRSASAPLPTNDFITHNTLIIPNSGITKTDSSKLSIQRDVLINIKKNNSYYAKLAEDVNKNSDPGFLSEITMNDVKKILKSREFSLQIRNSEHRRIDSVRLIMKFIKVK